MYLDFDYNGKGISFNYLGHLGYFRCLHWNLICSIYSQNIESFGPICPSEIISKKKQQVPKHQQKNWPCWILSKQKYTIKINSLNTLFLNYINFYSFILGRIAANLTSVSKCTLGSMWCTIHL